MADGRSKSLWPHTSSILCLLANVNRDHKRSRPFTPNQFNPHMAGRRKRRGEKITVDKLADDIMSLAKPGKRGRR